MMDPISGRNRGYCFVTFTDKKAAEEAVRQVIKEVFMFHLYYKMYFISSKSILTRSKQSSQRYR
jgi:RNA recognition motif-containing protein